MKIHSETLQTWKTGVLTILITDINSVCLYTKDMLAIIKISQILYTCQKKSIIGKYVNFQWINYIKIKAINIQHAFISNYLLSFYYYHVFEVMATIISLLEILHKCVGILHFFQTLCSVMTHWYLEIGHDMRIIVWKLVSARGFTYCFVDYLDLRNWCKFY